MNIFWLYMQIDILLIVPACNTKKPKNLEFDIKQSISSHHKIYKQQ
ncbi:hypothetical protein C3B55_00174 [Candidatus Pseudomonas adelgestsugas]|uniref:Lipoprotein n=1 Tax=Candidatus Pseudomonas adelgestsugas TaxID=1302376 RepID=A0ABX5R8N0_9PSED|nr:hypothetical protein C3B55_00174 [Candidatus Pseudomonas adelgestsugas]